MPCVVTIVAAAVMAGLLIHVGVCPITIQMLLVAAVLIAVFRAQTAQTIKAEHMTQPKIAGEPDLYAPPVADMLTHSVEAMRGGLDQAKSIVDDAAGGVFESQVGNTRDDVLVLSDPWSGPPSNVAGVFEDFTIAVTVTIPEQGQVSLFKAAAMTTTGLGAVEVRVQPGADGRRQLSLMYGDDTGTVSTDVAATKEPVTIICRKSGLKVVLQQATHSVTADNQRVELDMSDTARARPQVTTPVLLGAPGSAGGDALLSRLLVWKVAIPDDIINHIVLQGKMIALRKDDVFQSLISERDRAYKTAADAKTRNPYGSDAIQEACKASITDWTKPGEIAFATVGCKDSITDFCKANPDHPECACFGDAKKDTAACKQFLGLLKSSPPADLENLTPEELAAIVGKYGLQDPKAIAAAEAAKKLAECTAAKKPAAGAAAGGAAVVKKPRRRILNTNHELDEIESRLMTPGHGYWGRSAQFDQHDQYGRYGPTKRDKSWLEKLLFL
jgi:hypothetical protein